MLFVYVLVLGNELMFNFRSDIQLTSFDNRCIGYLVDESTSNVYLFITSLTSGLFLE